MVLLEQGATWKRVQKVLTDKDFVPKLKKFTPEDVTPSTLKLCLDYTRSKDFKPFKAADYSMALRYIC